MTIRAPFVFVPLLISAVIIASTGDAQENPRTETPEEVNPLPGTLPLVTDALLDVQMMQQAHQFIDRRIEPSDDHASSFWDRDPATQTSYNRSIEANRARLKFILGAGNRKRQPHSHTAFPPRQVQVQMQRIADDAVSDLLHSDPLVRIYRVRWPAMNGVFGEGLLLEPTGPSRASVIVLPDADQHPEQYVGLIAGVAAENQIARRLASQGVRVIVPMLINRENVTENKHVKISNREWIYRQSFQMGRHIIGYEIDKVTAAIDWLEKTAPAGQPIGIAGWGEGAMLAFYTAALDTRVDAALISGSWRQRQPVWAQPIYRNVWSLANGFDDANVASMIAPRKLLVEESEGPKIDRDRDKAMATQGQTASVLDAKAIATPSSDWLVAAPESKRPFSNKCQQMFVRSLGLPWQEVESLEIKPQDALVDFAQQRHRRQMWELDDYTQQLVRDSDQIRHDFYLDKVLPVLSNPRWSTAAEHPTSSVDDFAAHGPKYRKIFWDEVIGRFDEPLSDPNPRSRQIQKNEYWSAFDVVLDVTDDLFAWGILMLPNDLQTDDKRPVVVLQHGRNGLPQKILEGGYNGIAEKLVSQGYIVFAPHNLYRGEDRYRWLDRKANTIGKSLFSFLLLQHDQITRWLETLPNVDGQRIAFYGNSYGGESAVRIPTLLTRYALSICASDFNDWNQKVTQTHDRHSFMLTPEWEMPYFNMGNQFSYAELAYLMVPRPFMVERGHHDGVADDSWVAAEYAKVRLVYDQLGIGDRTAITYFQGGHTMRGVQTLEFLDRHFGPVRQPKRSR